MDLYKSESEFIDSLDFLSPPVKRDLNSKDVFSGVFNDVANNANLFRGIHNNVAETYEKVLKPKRNVKTGVESSTSLILKKTSDKQFLERYSFVSYTSLHTPNQNIVTHKNIDKHHASKDKPLIKVTVIPKTDHNQKTKLFRKRRHITKRIQSTLSNQDNSIQTKNLYLVVAGRRRDKIYELKTTGSATFASDQADNKNEDISVEGLSNVKHLIQSLNMDQHRNKEKDTKTDRTLQISFANNGNDPYESEDCACPVASKSCKKQSNRSRVRIFGQLGLTEDARYVLRYGATVNDKPVSDFAQLKHDFLPNLNPGYSCLEDNIDVKKDASVQANYEHDYRCLQSKAVPEFLFGIPYKESQGTQVNFNVQVTPRREAPLEVSKTLDKNIQCSCNNMNKNRLSEKQSEEVYDPKACPSPLVIISVYPKPSPDIITSVKNSSENKRTLSPTRIYTANAQVVEKSKEDKGTKKRMIESKKDNKKLEIKKNCKQLVSSRSPSPVKKISKVKMQEKNTDTKATKTQFDRKFSVGDKATKVVRNKTLEKYDMKKEEKATQNKADATSTSKATHHATKQVFKNQTPKRKASLHSEEKGTNTEHAKAKKVLVDNYTKKLTEHFDYKDSPARLNQSKVIVNIAEQNENYNVLFDKGNLTADLTIRKRMKDTGSQKGCCGNLSASLENLFLLSEPEPRMQSKSVALYTKQCQDTPTNERFSGIAIRDSLEISHRREGKNSCNMKNTQTGGFVDCFKEYMNDTEFLAPVKHYTGDDCSICDPVARDKQIRELLGVNKSKMNAQSLTPLPTQAHSSENDDCPYHCFYRSEREKNRVAEVNLVKFCPFLRPKRKASSKAPLSHRNYETIQPSTAETDADPTVIEQPYYKMRYAPKRQNKHQNNRNRHRNSYLHYECKESPKECFDSGQGSYPMKANTENSAFYQQLILNRNIQVFLQVEQFSKQRPIVLSRQQYDKVKRTIQNTICNMSSKEKRKKIIERCQASEVSVGKVRRKNTMHMKLNLDKQMQTDHVPNSQSTSRKSSRKDRMISKMRHISKVPRVKYAKQKQNIFRKSDKGEIHNTAENYIAKERIHRQTKQCDKPIRKYYRCAEDQYNRIGEYYKITGERYRPRSEFNRPNMEYHQTNREYGNHYQVSAEQERHTEEYLRLSEEYHRKYPIDSGSPFRLIRERYRPSSPISSRQRMYGEDQRVSEGHCTIGGIRYRYHGDHLLSTEHHKRHGGCNKPSEELYRETEEYLRAGGKQGRRKHQITNADPCKVVGQNLTGRKEYNEPKFDHFKVSDRHHKNIGQLRRGDVTDPPLSTKLKEPSRDRNEVFGEVNAPIAKHFNQSKEQDKCNKIDNVHISHKEYLTHNESREENLELSADQKLYSKSSIETETDGKQSEEIETYPKHSGEQLKGGETEVISIHSRDHQNTEEDLNHNSGNEFIDIKKEGDQKSTVMLYKAKDKQGHLEINSIGAVAKKTMSSMEIRCTSMAYIKKIDVSSDDLAIPSQTSVGHVHSFQTIFRGHRKSPTPNLGTSVYSLYSEDGFNSDKSANFIMEPRDTTKPIKKPFLRRLMSCLVMRSTRASELKIPIIPVQHQASVNSSVDSYHFSTSLGAVEVTSSIYDTSASFYSNHTILPINSKIKRGFFSSVRGFLTNRRS